MTRNKENLQKDMQRINYHLRIYLKFSPKINKLL